MDVCTKRELYLYNFTMLYSIDILSQVYTLHTAHIGVPDTIILVCVHMHTHTHTHITETYNRDTYPLHTHTYTVTYTHT